MSDPRREQFAGWANAVFDKLLQNQQEDNPERVLAILARAGYALVGHTLDNTGSYMLDCLSLTEAIAEIPDLPVLPEEEK